MSTPFQNRLVGTVIVAAAAVIFLPDFLDGTKKEYQADFEGIPAAPVVVSKPAIDKFPKEKVVSLVNNATTNQQEKSTKVTSVNVKDSAIKSVIKPPMSNSEQVKVNTLQEPSNFTSSSKVISEAKVKSTPTPQKNKVDGQSLKQKIVTQWVIQLGSFRHEKNVKELVNKLTSNGFKAFTKPIKTKNGSLTKVFVGPELIKSTLEKKIPKLKELTKVDGKVSKYNVTK